MAVVGFRCFKDTLSFVVLSGTPDAPHIDDHGHVRMPQVSRAEQLAWVRREVLEILNRTRPSQVAFKGIEGSAQVKDTGRAEVEGVLQEAAYSAGTPPLRRLKAQIRADVGFKEPARYVDKLLTRLPKLPANRREAALAALAVLGRA